MQLPPPQFCRKAEISEQPQSAKPRGIACLLTVPVRVAVELSARPRGPARPRCPIPRSGSRRRRATRPGCGRRGRRRWPKGSAGRRGGRRPRTRGVSQTDDVVALAVVASTPAVGRVGHERGGPGQVLEEAAGLPRGDVPDGHQSGRDGSRGSAPGPAAGRGDRPAVGREREVIERAPPRPARPPAGRWPRPRAGWSCRSWRWRPAVRRERRPR